MSRESLPVSVELEHDGEPEGEENAIEMSDLIALQLSTVLSLSITPTFSVGTMSKDRSRILVPMMSCVLKGRFGEDDDPTPVTGLVTLDNLAFLAARLGDEFLKAITVLDGVSQGEILPRADRLKYASELLNSSAASLAEAAEKMDGLAARAAKLGTAAPVDEGQGSKASAIRLPKKQPEKRDAEAAEPRGKRLKRVPKSSRKS